MAVGPHALVPSTLRSWAVTSVTDQPARSLCSGPGADRALGWGSGFPVPSPLFPGGWRCLFSPSLPLSGAGAPLCLSRLKDVSLEHCSSCLDCKLSSDLGHILRGEGVPGEGPLLAEGEAHP